MPDEKTKNQHTADNEQKGAQQSCWEALKLRVIKHFKFRHPQWDGKYNHLFCKSLAADVRGSKGAYKTISNHFPKPKEAEKTKVVDGIIAMPGAGSTPSDDFLNAYARYIGKANFSDFCRSIQSPHIIPPLPQGTSVLKGFDSFTEADKEVFSLLQRQADIDATTKAILKDKYRWIFLLGESGVGKSSLVSAGVIPALKEQGILPVKIDMTDDQPALALATQLTAAFEGTTEEASQQLSTFFKTHTDEPIVLIMDQFEQLYTSKHKGIRKQFEADLANWLSQCRQLNCLVVMRDDYVHCLYDLKADNQLVVHSGAVGNELLLKRFSVPQAVNILQLAFQSDELKGSIDIDFEAFVKEELWSEEDEGVLAVDMQLVLEVLLSSKGQNQPLDAQKLQALGSLEDMYIFFLQTHLSANNNFKDSLIDVLNVLVEPPDEMERTTAEDKVVVGKLSAEEILEKLPRHHTASKLHKQFDYLQKTRIIRSTVQKDDPKGIERYRLRHERLIRPIEDLYHHKAGPALNYIKSLKRKRRTWLNYGKRGLYLLAPLSLLNSYRHMKVLSETERARLNDFVRASRNRLLQLAGICLCVLGCALGLLALWRSDHYFLNYELEDKIVAMMIGGADFMGNNDNKGIIYPFELHTLLSNLYRTNPALAFDAWHGISDDRASLGWYFKILGNTYSSEDSAMQATLYRYPVEKEKYEQVVSKLLSSRKIRFRLEALFQLDHSPGKSANEKFDVSKNLIDTTLVPNLPALLSLINDSISLSHLQIAEITNFIDQLLAKIDSSRANAKDKLDAYRRLASSYIAKADPGWTKQFLNQLLTKIDSSKAWKYPSYEKVFNYSRLASSNSLVVLAKADPGWTKQFLNQIMTKIDSSGAQASYQVDVYSDLSSSSSNTLTLLAKTDTAWTKQFLNQFLTKIDSSKADAHNTLDACRNLALSNSLAVLAKSDTTWTKQFLNQLLTKIDSSGAWRYPYKKVYAYNGLALSNSLAVLAKSDTTWTKQFLNQLLTKIDSSGADAFYTSFHKVDAYGEIARASSLSELAKTDPIWTKQFLNQLLIKTDSSKADADKIVNAYHALSLSNSLTVLAKTYPDWTKKFLQQLAEQVDSSEISLVNRYQTKLSMLSHWLSVGDTLADFSYDFAAAEVLPPERLSSEAKFIARKDMEKLAQQLLKQGRTKEVEALLQKLAPTDYLPRCVIANAYALQGDTGRAYRIVKGFPDSGPGSGEKLLSLIYILDARQKRS